MKKAIIRNSIARVMFGLLFLLVVAVSAMTAVPKTAQAAGKTTPKYLVHFSYSASITSNTTVTSGGSANDTTSCSAKIGQYTSATFQVYMWGSGQSGTGELANGGYINSSTVTISVDTTCSPNVVVKNSSDSVVGSGTKTITLNDLADGTYKVTIGAGSGWLVSNRQYMNASVSITYSFKVDTVTPTLSGASTSTTGKYTNAAFTVTASDAASGAQTIYMKSPTASSFSSVGSTSKTVSASETNGLYSFYATDKAGNSSATYYVYLDTSKPTITLSPNKTYYNANYTVTVADTGSGVQYYQYTTPSGNSYTSTSASATMGVTENGQYTYRVIDNAGNISADKVIYVDTVKPTGVVYSGTTAKTSGAKVNGDYIKFVGGDTLSGLSALYVKLPNATSYTAYTSGSQYATEGTYSFYCTDNAGNTSDTYTITLDKTKPTGTITNSSGTTLTGAYTNAAFKYTATDAIAGLSKVEYKTPGSSSWATYTSGSTIAATATNGQYQFRATDNAGNVSDVKSITLDSTKPTGQVYGGTTALASGSFTNAGKIKFVTSDATSGLKSAYVKGPNATEYTAYTSGAEYTAEGTYYFYSVDNANNSSATYSITLDMTPPKILIAPPGGGTVYTNGSMNQDFSCVGYDLGSDFAKLEYMRPSDTAWQNYIYSTTIPATSGDGLYTFRAQDRAGNYSETITVLLDTVKPIATIYGGTTVLSNGANTNAANVSFAASDDSSGIKQMYVKLPGSTQYTTYTTGTKYTDNGTYSFYCTDKAGNSSVTYTVTFDSSVPTGSIKDGGGGVLTSTYTNKAFSYSASDSGVGIDKLQYTTPSNSSWVTYTSGTVIPATSTNGKYQFRALDKAGNVSEVKSITLDTVKPSGTLYGGTTAVTSGATTNAGYIKFVPSDSLSGVDKTYYKAPKATSYAAYTSGNQLTENGTYSFYCEDKAGNASATFTVLLDNIAPTLVCSQVAFYEEYDDDFTVSVSDGLSSVSLYYKTTAMTSYAKATGNSYTVKDSEPNGKYYFYATDTAGNTSQTYWIQLNVVYPTATIITDEETNTITITWADNSTGQLNGVQYTKNTKISKEGDYSFVLTSAKNRSTTYNFALTHSYYVDEVIEPTCTEQGYTVYRCKSCDSTYNADYINAIGHDYRETVETATCTTEGGIRHTCSRCGDEYVTDVEKPFGHTYFEYSVPVSCVQDGCIRHECSVCGFTYDSDVIKAIGHDYVTEVKTPATCTEDGLRTHLCRRCGDLYENVIPAFGHNYEITDVEGEQGYTIRTYTCTKCGDSYQQDLGNQYEEVSNYVEYLFQKYRPYMVYVFLGTAGVWSIAMGIAIIIARKNDEKEKAKKMLVNYGIGMIVIFAILIAVPLLIRGIAALVAG